MKRDTITLRLSRKEAVHLDTLLCFLMGNLVTLGLAKEYELISALLERVEEELKDAAEA